MRVFYFKAIYKKSKMALDKDTPIFDDISFSDIARDIYKKKKEKDNLIEKLINELSPLIKNVNDAAMLVPLLKEYAEVGVKNDEILVKLSAIIQKLLIADGKSTSGDMEFALSADEKRQLLLDASELKNQVFKD